MFKQNKAFTLVELIVVIAILAILGTIAFLSLQGYSSSARDSVRVSDFGNIKTSLELYKTTTGYYPEPTNGIKIAYSGAEVWTQGTIGDSVINNLQKINKKPVDPLTSSEYTYSRLNTKKEYEIASIFEGDEISLNNNIIPQVYVQDNLLSYVKGTYNGVMSKVSTGSLIYILSIPTIISSDIGNVDVMQILQNKSLAYNGFKNLPSSYNGLGYTIAGGFDFAPVNAVVFSGSITDLEDINNLKYLTSNLQNTYIGSELELFGIYLNIIGIDVNNDGAVSSNIGNIINNNLGGKLTIINDIHSGGGGGTEPGTREHGTWYDYTGPTYWRGALEDKYWDGTGWVRTPWLDWSDVDLIAIGTWANGFRPSKMRLTFDFVVPGPSGTLNVWMTDVSQSIVMLDMTGTTLTQELPLDMSSNLDINYLRTLGQQDEHQRITKIEFYY